LILVFEVNCAKFHCAILLKNDFHWQLCYATNMLLGYARVSKSDDQDTVAQTRVLKEAGCEKIFEETASGGRWDRPELHRLLDNLRKDDVVVVWKLDRLTRSLKDLLLILEKIDTAGAGFRSLTEAIDTTVPAGRMLTHMLGSFAEFERAMIRERTRAGLRAAREEGRVGGRKPKLDAQQRQEIIDAVLSGRKRAAQVARLFKVHPATVCRMVAEARVKRP
jgi:DNA invertase Pin-like site-specific DNA recombinase